LGTRRVQTDELGVIEQSCSSLPFGDGLSCTGSTTAPTEHHFTGKERDTESGNDYFGARYYSSSMGRFLSPDWSAKVAPVPYAKLDNPQTLNLYAYVGNNPLNRTDPTGHYTAGCGGDVKNCDKQIGSLDKQLQSALKSKDPNIVKAAQAYGKLGDKNGVNVTFLNVVDPKNANVTGTTGAQAGTGGITVDQATGKVQQATQVNLQAGMGGSQLQETAVHEGVHVEDRANFIGTIQMTPYSFNQNLNISGRQSEMNAYGVENEWRQGNGMPTININDQLSHPPYSTNSNIDKPILPDFPGPQ
jgi:RHS repeat-associated protein